MVDSAVLVSVRAEDVKPGDYVKVTYTVPVLDDIPEKYRGFKERLWTRVESVDLERGTIKGILDQAPLIKFKDAPTKGQPIEVFISSITAKINPAESF